MSNGFRDIAAAVREAARQMLVADRDTQKMPENSYFREQANKRQQEFLDALAGALADAAASENPMLGRNRNFRPSEEGTHLCTCEQYPHALWCGRYTHQPPAVAPAGIPVQAPPATVAQWLARSGLRERLAQQPFRVPGTSRTENVTCHVIPQEEMQQLMQRTFGNAAAATQPPQAGLPVPGSTPPMPPVKPPRS